MAPRKANDGSFYEPTQLRGLIPGNMAFAHGCLVVAGIDELAVYVSPARLRDKLAQSRFAFSGGSVSMGPGLGRNR